MTLITNDITDFLNLTYSKNFKIKALQEEASTRRYFLITTANKSEVLCIDKKINQEFILLSGYLLLNGITVPAVLSTEEKLGLMILSFGGRSDLSVLTLEEYKKKLPDAIDIILKFQKLTPPSLVLDRKFDFEKLMYEINFTVEKFKIFKTMFYINTELSMEALVFLEEAAAFLDKHPVNVFTHRDFHSRNLLLNENQDITLIDFQDARMGVPQYDLASILYDAYYPLPQDFRKQMLDYFQSKSIGSTIKFKETFYLQALQRSFKALGTYFRLVADEKNSKFKSSILSCLQQLEEIIQLGLFPDSLYIFTKSLRNELAKHPEFKLI